MAYKNADIYRGKTSYHHRILPRRFGAGLLDELQHVNPGRFKLHSMDTKEMFEKYFRESEGASRVLSTIKTLCRYLKPEMTILVDELDVPYLTGVNNAVRRFLYDNTNRIFLIFERFPHQASSGSTNGHFMLAWHFPETFQVSAKRAKTNPQFCLFDPFGRTRQNDPEEFYYQKAHYFDYQHPDSDTCALWTIFALIQFALQASRFRGITPVEYDGKDSTLDLQNFKDMHNRQLMENERNLYKAFVTNYIIFQPNQQIQRTI